MQEIFLEKEASTSGTDGKRKKYGYTDIMPWRVVFCIVYRLMFNTELESAAPTELYDDSDGWRDEWRDVEAEDDLSLLDMLMLLTFVARIYVVAMITWMILPATIILMQN